MAGVLNNQNYTEDEVREMAGYILGFKEEIKNVKAGVGQLTTFNQLGFKGVNDKPDGWYLPDNTNDPAIILEAKSSLVELKDKNIISIPVLNFCYCQYYTRKIYQVQERLLRHSWKAMIFQVRRLPYLQLQEEAALERL